MGSEKIKSTMCTHSDRRNHEEYSYLVNAVDKVSGEKLAVEVATTDYGIAVVDACQRRIKNNVKRRLKIDANAGICYRRLPFRRNVCSRCRLDTGFCSVF